MPILYALLLLGSLICTLPAQRDRPEVQAANLILTRYGFEDSDVEMSAGRVSISVRNLTGLTVLDLRLEHIPGEGAPREILRRAKAPRRERKWRDAYVLTAGTYQLSEENHPEWVCTITVSPALSEQ